MKKNLLMITVLVFGSADQFLGAAFPPLKRVALKRVCADRYADVARAGYKEETKRECPLTAGEFYSNLQDRVKHVVPVPRSPTGSEDDYVPLANYATPQPPPVQPSLKPEDRVANPAQRREPVDARNLTWEKTVREDNTSCIIFNWLFERGNKTGNMDYLTCDKDALKKLKDPTTVYMFTPSGWMSQIAQHSRLMSDHQAAITLHLDEPVNADVLTASEFYTQFFRKSYEQEEMAARREEAQREDDQDFPVNHEEDFQCLPYPTPADLIAAAAPQPTPPQGNGSCSVC